MTDRTALRALLAAATPRPWRVHSKPKYWIELPIDEQDHDPNRDNNAALVAAMRNQLPALLDALDAAEAERGRLAELVDTAETVIVGAANVSAEMVRLRKLEAYARHTSACEVTRGMEGAPCTCGLEEARK